jgi:hypothetical protein
MPASALPPITGEPLPPPPLKTVSVVPTKTWAPSPVPSAADLDSRYLTDLTDAGLRITDARVAVQGAHKLCEYLAAGHSEAEAVRLSMSNNADLTESDARAFVVTAVRVYCPNQAD